MHWGKKLSSLYFHDYLHFLQYAPLYLRHCRSLGRTTLGQIPSRNDRPLGFRLHHHCLSGINLQSYSSPHILEVQGDDYFRADRCSEIIEEAGGDREEDEGRGEEVEA